MGVPIIGTGTNTLKNASTTSSSLDTLSTDFDSFLTLLTTQLKNQDPTSPMETNEFTQQIIGFSQVQQAINTNTNLEKLIESNKNSAIANAVSYVDQFVVAETDEFNLKNGAAFLSYELPKAAGSVTLTVKDDKGKIINAYDVDASQGYHKVTWDGKDKNGQAMPAGKYNFSIVARDAENTPIEGSKTFVTELVTQVDLQGEDTEMYFGDIKFGMDKIRSVIGYYAPTDVPPVDETATDAAAEAAKKAAEEAAKKAAEEAAAKLAAEEAAKKAAEEAAAKAAEDAAKKVAEEAAAKAASEASARAAQEAAAQAQADLATQAAARAQQQAAANAAAQQAAYQAQQEAMQRAAEEAARQAALAGAGA